MEMIPEHWFKTCFPFGYHGCCHVFLVLHPDVRKRSFKLVSCAFIAVHFGKSQVNNKEMSTSEQ